MDVGTGWAFHDVINSSILTGLTDSYANDHDWGLLNGQKALGMSDPVKSQTWAIF